MVSFPQVCPSEPTQCIYVFCTDLRTNSDYFRTEYQLVVFFLTDSVPSADEFIWYLRWTKLPGTGFLPHSTSMSLCIIPIISGFRQVVGSFRA